MTLFFALTTAVFSILYLLERNECKALKGQRDFFWERDQEHRKL